MSILDVTLHLPEHLYDWAQDLAEATSQPMEVVLVQKLENVALPPLPMNEQAELDAMGYLSNDALWAIAREKMPRAQQEVMQSLMDANTRGTITDEESLQLEDFVEQGQRRMLRKGKAAALLTQRGYNITAKTLS